MQSLPSEAPKEEVLYEDKYAKLTSTTLTIFHYHIFFGMSKQIPLSRIKSVALKDIDGWVKYRMWGMSWKHWWRWFPLDISRHKKKKFIEIDLGKLVVPAITPEDPERLFQLLQEILSGRQLTEKARQTDPLGVMPEEPKNEEIEGKLD